MKIIDIQERKQSYSESHCWQYEIRSKRLSFDMDEALSFFKNDLEVTSDVLQALSIKDFSFEFEEKINCFNEVKEFIERHEWLGRMSLYPTHIFTARFRGYLCGAVILDMPASFSKLLGEDTRKIERSISRGACISFSPKNLASSLVMFAINWMAKNTEYRLFTAYSDPEAKELGTIYQACNFFYLGKNSGTSFQYKIENGRWVSDRYFRCRSVYKRLAKDAGIVWDSRWQRKDSVFLNLMPDEVRRVIKKLSAEYTSRCEKRKVTSKHKYAYVLGSTKSETKKLRSLFLEKNKTFSYPKIRGQ